MGFIDTTTIIDRLERGFLSDTAEGRKQIRAAKVRTFFSDYANFSGDDGSELQQRAFELGITEAEWNAYHASFRTEF